MILDVARQTLTDGEQMAALSKQRAAIVAAIARNHGFETYERIVARVWAVNEEPENVHGVILVQVSYIRSALRAAGIDLRIWTTRKSGLNLSHPVTVIERVEPPVMIPAALRGDLERILNASAHRAAVERIYAAMAV